MAPSGLYARLCHAFLVNIYVTVTGVQFMYVFNLFLLPSLPASGKFFFHAT